MTLVIAHRGASWDEPENTPAAFERAIAVGADYVELDVHVDARGELVVTHDPPRAARGLPTLAEIVELCRGRIPVMVELKTPYRYRRFDVVRRTVELVDDDAVILCFQRRPLDEVRARRPQLRTMQHVGLGVSIRRAGDAWAVGFENGRVSRRALARATALGYETAVYTVNDERRMRELAALGVGAIFTDRPALLLAALGRRPRA